MQETIRQTTYMKEIERKLGDLQRRVRRLAEKNRTYNWLIFHEENEYICFTFKSRIVRFYTE